MIRAPGEADLPVLIALMHALAGDQREPARATEATVRRQFLDDAPQGWALVAEEAGRLIGYATALPAFESTHDVRGAYVADLFVLPECRGQGHGRALLAAMAARVRDGGAQYLWWVAKAWNTQAHAFYRRLGCIEEPVIAFAATTEAFQRLADSA